MKFSGAILTAGLFIAVCAQMQPIVDKTYVPIGGMFTVTCDANRFPPGSIPSHLNAIAELSIDRCVGKEPRETIAVYLPYPFPSYSNVSKFIPTGRNWIVEASGGIPSGDPPINNKATIKIELVVKDAKCSDAGIYSCNASYLTLSTGTVKISNSHDLKSNVFNLSFV
ncbi:unnamed protein product [Lymnaea stagnalis]|uniref:Ig-like domain-containing protein n=1 Tax=Lymnaea stagnalis TaxID=6523 RepID=A0AAV2IJC9_LYMST